MDYFYYYPHFHFPFFGFLFTLFIGFMIGRWVTFRRMRREGGWAYGPCGYHRSRETPEAGRKTDAEGGKDDRPLVS